jgi:hypothetical protein
MAAQENEVSRVIRQLAQKNQIFEAALKKITGDHNELLRQLESQPRSITEEIDSIPGRRIFYNFVDRIDFTLAQDGLRGEPLNFLVSQDGPYIATHYPMVVWNPNSPDTASNFGQWSPPSSWPLPTQQNAFQDRIDLSYEMVDGGSQRNFQNASAGPLFSRPDNAIPLPVPTLFAPNSVIQFFPTYETIFFDPSVVGNRIPTTGGSLVVTIPGYKIVNM